MFVYDNYMVWGVVLMWSHNRVVLFHELKFIKYWGTCLITLLGHKDLVNHTLVNSVYKGSTNVQCNYTI